MLDRRGIHAVVHGHVQGVGFRYKAQQAANDLDLTGWVRNRPDRTVEVEATGTETAITKFIGFLEAGPRGAIVTQLDIDETFADTVHEGFQIRY